MTHQRLEDVTGGELLTKAGADKQLVLDASDTTDDPDGTIKYITLDTMGVTYLGVSGTTTTVGGAKKIKATTGTLELGPVIRSNLEGGASSSVLFVCDNTFSDHVEIRNFGSGESSLTLSGAGGAESSPAAIGSSPPETLGQLYFRGHDGTVFQNGAAYKCEAPTMWTAGNRESQHRWRGVPNGSTALENWMLLDDGGLTIEDGNLRSGGSEDLTFTPGGNNAVFNANVTYNEGGDSVASGFQANSYGAAGGFWARRRGGTKMAPSAVSNGDFLGALQIEGYDGTADGSAVSWGANATETWSVGNHGACGYVNATAQGATTATRIATFDADDGVSFFDTSGSNKVAIKSGTANTGTLAWNDGSDDAYIRYEHSGQNLLFAAAGSERMRIASTGELVVGTTTVGGASGLTLYPSGVFYHQATVKPQHEIDSGTTWIERKFNADRSGADAAIDLRDGYWNGLKVATIGIETGDDTVNKDDGRITFATRESGGALAEQFRIEPDCVAIPDDHSTPSTKSGWAKIWSPSGSNTVKILFGDGTEKTFTLT